MKTTIDTAQTDLVSFRERYGQTLQKISDKTGIAISTLIDIEKGRKKPQAKTIFKMNEYLSTFD
jgi:transcriptional regulator with XRE-family HTH domain